MRSTFLKIKTGILQGTVLGPILFSLYINDFPDVVCPDIGLLMYADDTVVYASADTFISVADKLNTNLERISSWLASSCLTLNTKITNSVCFSIQKLPLTQLLNIKINGELIEQVSEVKYLGINIDYQLNFKSHIKKICKTIRANLSCFMMIRNCLTLDCAFIFFNSMILSHISYGLTTWSQAHQSSVKTIQCFTTEP